MSILLIMLKKILIPVSVVAALLAGTSAAHGWRMPWNWEPATQWELSPHHCTIWMRNRSGYRYEVGRGAPRPALNIEAWISIAVNPPRESSFRPDQVGHLALRSGDVALRMRPGANITQNDRRLDITIRDADVFDQFIPILFPAADIEIIRYGTDEVITTFPRAGLSESMAELDLCVQGQL